MALDRGENRRHLVAERDRNRLLQIAATGHRRVAMFASELHQRRRNPDKLVLDDRQPLPDLQHRRRIGDVLGRRAPVAVLTELVATERVQLRDDAENRIADALGLRAQLVEIELRDVAVTDDFVRGFLRDDAEAALHDRQRLFDLDVLRGTVFVGPHVTHRFAAEDVAEDARIDDG